MANASGDMGERLRQAIVEAAKSVQPLGADLLYGTVLATTPLAVQLESGITLSEDQILLSPFCDTSPYWTGIEQGNVLGLLRLHNGQLYWALQNMQQTIKTPTTTVLSWNSTTNGLTFANYNSVASNAPTVTRDGMGNVYFRGFATVTGTFTYSDANTETVMFTLPSNCRPALALRVLCPAQDGAMFRMRVNPTGNVTFARYIDAGTTAGRTDFSAGKWVDFCAAFKAAS
ncbi:MAG: DUF2577 domain-containing protein [Clostridium sp.]|nr:DUF2577 domain-containing protein [Clostridium sp.]